jgi:outer membrane protein TolC
MQRRTIVFCLSFLSLPLLKGDDLSLDQAITLALNNNRHVTNARFELMKADLQVDIARTNRLPAFHLYVYEAQAFKPVDFSFPAGIWGVYPATGPIPAQGSNISTPHHPFTFVNASMTQPLLQLPKINTGIRLRQTERDVEQAKSDSLQLDIVSDVRKLYYEILQTQGAVTANASSIDTLRELDRYMSESVAQRVALQSESLDAKARLAKAEYDSATLLHDLASEKEQLNELMGRDARIEFDPKPLPELSIAPVDLDQARAHASAEHPAIREARLRIEEAQRDRQLKKAEFLPTVNFSLQYLSPFNFEILPKNLAAAGIEVTWDVFDWGKKKKELAIKDVAIAEAKNELGITESQVLVDVETRFRKLEDARRMLDVVRAAQQAAQEKVRIAKDRYDGQAALLKDLLESRSSQAGTDYQYQQALASYLTARADFDKAAANQ